MYSAEMKVLLVVIDAATARVVSPAIKTGQLPTMQRLAEAGRLHESVTMFPSITPAATTTIITGHYPAKSGIVGASWYDEGAENVAYFGDDFWVIAREGFRAFLDDFLVGLNGDRLRAPTLFQTVERAGKSAMCLNYLIFKGDVEHTVKIPGLLAMLPARRAPRSSRAPPSCAWETSWRRERCVVRRWSTRAASSIALVWTMPRPANCWWKWLRTAPLRISPFVFRR